MKNPAGYGGIIKLSGKRRRPYAVRVTAGWSKEGKQIFKYISYHENRADAVKALAEYNSIKDLAYIIESDILTPIKSTTP